MTTDAGGSFATNVLLFGRVLRAAGLDVHHGRVIDALHALEAVGIRSRADVRATLRSLLVHRHDDLDRFDAAFDLFFRAHRHASPGLPLFSLGERPRVVVQPMPGGKSPNAVPPRQDHADARDASGRGSSPISVSLDDADHVSREIARRAVGVWSRADVLRTKDFSEFTDAELDRARDLLQHFPWKLSVRRTRRWERASDGAVNLRPLLRRNLTNAGELLDLPRRRRRQAARPIVLIADVSGSMERYSRVVLQFVYGLAHSGTRAETFMFSTRLTRVTRQLSQPRGVTRSRG